MSLATMEAQSCSAPRRRRMPAGHIQAIDGLRAVAVLGVVAFHLNALPGGFLGVDLFFVISGYVITRAILTQREAGTFRLGRFWFSRIKRLLPAVLLVLIAVEVWIAVVAPAGLERVTDGQSLSSLVYGTNWFNIAGDFGYADASRESSPLNHLWSLAIEEQFYLLWPALLLLLPKRWLVLAVTTAGVGAGLVYGVAAQQFWSFDRLYQGTDVRMVALVGGAMIAAFGAGGGPSPLPRAFSRALRRLAPWMALASAVALAWLWATLPLDRRIFGGPLALAIVLEIVLVASIAAPSARLFASVLSWGPLVFIGRRSYALYLWHWPVIVIVSETYTGWTDWDLAAARAVAMVLLTMLSYALIENPIRRMKNAGPGLWIGLAAAIAAVVALASLPGGAWAPSSGAPRAQGSTDPRLAAIEPGRKVLVAGDSWAAALAQGMTDPEFGATVENYGRGGCGIADPQAYMNDDASVVPPPAQCLAWRAEWASAVEKDRPDAVVLTTETTTSGRRRSTAGGSMSATLCSTPATAHTSTRPSPSSRARGYPFSSRTRWCSTGNRSTRIPSR
ncbi:acyltransferase [Leifsonia sp. fls2-241-R2A-40a]|uniref:acyltransferase family protein n=1 Tax=Leifsonia sp. fls2-241-R2A-40a TaxID=3040290 RepID=UPI00254D52EF|nr:acyltransferase [Leifsonia sp. fls2-241-R2A-40a]